MTGRLESLHVFFVKSLPGTAPSSVAIEPEGLVGDRSHALVDADGEVLKPKVHPRLRELGLSGTLEVVVPGGADLAEFLGVPGARVATVDGGARQVEAVHLVTLAQRAVPGAGDSRRANLVLDVPEPAHWLGARVLVGAVELEVTAVPKHCAGVFARVLVPGTARVGDAVQVLAGPHG